MKVSKQQMILGAVLLGGALILAVDSFVIRRGGEQEAAAATSEDALPSRAATSAASEQPAVSLSQRLEQAGQPFADKPLRDAFSAGASAKDQDDRSARFRQSHQLTGVMSSGGQSVAIVDGGIIGIGQKVDGFTLVSISHRAATFGSATGEVVLSLAERPDGSVAAGN
jgi:hypothetical protein